LSIENNYFIIEIDPFFEQDMKKLGRMEKDLKSLNIEIKHNCYSSAEMSNHLADARSKAFVEVLKTFAQTK